MEKNPKGGADVPELSPLYPLEPVPATRDIKWSPALSIFRILLSDSTTNLSLLLSPQIAGNDMNVNSSD